MNVSVIHCSSKIIFLILNYLTLFLHARNVSENTVYKPRSLEGVFLAKMTKKLRIPPTFVYIYCLINPVDVT
ncbi:hypothetical protein CN307_09015 [Bacillus cereus]|uniref:Uncharacterized protein n=1 Tax=Bacillus cereus TaxID=1396 RepID=A0A2A9A2I9_BACCE|nr:hypothetical protein CN307_09015 [Bacillus cereus]